MNREKALKIAWPVLIGILVLVWGRALKGAAPRRPGEQFQDRAAVTAPEGGAGTGFVTINMPGPPKKSSHADWGRNPFVFSSGVSQDITLGGILWDINRPAAIISGEIVSKGDSVGRYVVVDVQQDRVILNDGQKDIDLRLGKGE